MIVNGQAFALPLLSIPVLRLARHQDLLEAGRRRRGFDPGDLGLHRLEELLQRQEVGDVDSLEAQSVAAAFLRRSGNVSIIRYESSSRDFVADLGFDQDGLCLSYPGIGRAV